jgi:hypothetical protein
MLTLMEDDEADVRRIRRQSLGVVAGAVALGIVVVAGLVILLLAVLASGD